MATSRCWVAVAAAAASLILYGVHICMSSPVDRHAATVANRAASPSRQPTEDATLEYYIVEDFPANTLVGNVPRDFRLNERYVPPAADGSFNFRFLSRAGPADRNVFVIDEKTGVIRTTERIDREEVCNSGMRGDIRFVSRSGSDKTETVEGSRDDNEACYFSLDIVVQPMRYFRIIRARVEILDVNDHAPTFPRPSVEHRISESAEQGASLPIDPAEDRDAGVNGQCEYRLETSPDDNGVERRGIDKFRLVVDSRPDGTARLKLVLVDRLDREKVDFFRFVVVAVDGGHAIRLSGSVIVNIRVMDVNDNAPEFRPTSHFRANIAEDVPIGHAVVRLSAVDPDVGKNAELRYSLVDRSITEYGRVFGVEPETGLVYTRQVLDRETVAGAYRLYVVVHDSGGPEAEGALSAHAVVEIEVTDVNDNAPQICMRPPTWNTVAPFKQPADTPAAKTATSATARGSGNITGSEVVGECRTDFDRQGFIVYMIDGTNGGGADDNGIVPSRDDVIGFVAHVTVIDPDAGNNSRFDCELHADGMSSFELRRLYTTEFVIVSSRQKPDNRSTTSGHSSFAAAYDEADAQSPVRELSVVCRDHGQPEMTSSVDVRIIRRDGGCGLRFASSHFHVGVDENNQADAMLLQTSATCQWDPAPTDHIRYRLAVSEAGAGDGSYSTLVAVDRVSGVVTARKSFDREEISSFEFRVVAEIVSGDGDSARDEDRQRQRLSSRIASTRVSVTIRDIDDERPTFDRKRYSFSVSENRAPGTTVGHLTAVDRDTFPFNRVVYSLDPNADQTFGVDPTSGLLFTRLPLDRERRDSYRAVVTAASPAMNAEADEDELHYFADTAEVDIQVDDVNDNRPVFVFPVESGGGGDTVRLHPRDAADPGYQVTRIQATDDDVGPNAHLVYRIASERAIVSGVERDAASTTSGLFRIDSDSGVITVAVHRFRRLPADLIKTGSEFLLVVVVSDLGVPIFSTSATLRILITDANSSSPNAPVGLRRTDAAGVGGSGEAEAEQPSTTMPLTDDDLALIATFGLAAFVASGCVIAIVFCASRGRHRRRSAPVGGGGGGGGGAARYQRAVRKDEDLLGDVCWASSEMAASGAVERKQFEDKFKQMTSDTDVNEVSLYNYRQVTVLDYVLPTKERSHALVG
jgi:hypothetical protein